MTVDAQSRFFPVCTACHPWSNKLCQKGLNVNTKKQGQKKKKKKKVEMSKFYFFQCSKCSVIFMLAKKFMTLFGGRKALNVKHCHREKDKYKLTKRRRVRKKR